MPVGQTQTRFHIYLPMKIHCVVLINSHLSLRIKTCRRRTKNKDELAIKIELKTKGFCFSVAFCALQKEVKTYARARVLCTRKERKNPKDRRKNRLDRSKTSTKLVKTIINSNLSEFRFLRFFSFKAKTVVAFRGEKQQCQNG